MPSHQSSLIEIAIAYTHDLHGHLYGEWTGTDCRGGMPLLSAKVDQLRALRPLLLLDCGDIMTGAPVNDLNGGLPMIEVMNAIGYDAMALDNHEFDPGVSALKAMISSADFEILSANVDWPGYPKPLAYSIETVAG
jgi:2',3'-cyclic-nucleotide 2'-phosphodiesterase (5'-nucleotidase family)